MQALFSFRALGRLVTQALRWDDCAFFDSVAGSASEFLEPSQVKQFWTYIRRSLPKFKDRRFGFGPVKLEILKDQWVPYFQKLEICEVRTPEEIITKCHDRQISMPLVQCSFELEDLPSLIEVEDVLRQSQPDRATGLDPLPSGLFRCHAVDLATIYFPVVLKMCQKAVP